ncbi:hypothetical protein BCR37DRAFT_386929 [Protomyces lactucae-debilis]|uniref:Uncharacterized protein n=1 Tax=Protomyces lactucae-debilis TaxID=2754530 RepID=A0A1Y2FGJ0_PROLT|nr:uncharacterized protein BCR37DRAFT_386929 [Protomyces lactucae-debilis]ORY83042.1 hypothetical protein BCR37DRAFT_386929 [Protomyces lactucae-debilis]
MSSIPARTQPGAGFLSSSQRGVWQGFTRPVRAPVQCAGGGAWSRASASGTGSRPIILGPCRRGDVKTISHLSYSDEYKDAEQAIKEIVVPTIRQHFPEMDFASSLVLYEDIPTVLVGVRDPVAVRPFLQTEYGGLPVLLVSATTETRTDTLDPALIDRTAGKAIGASIASSQADFAGTLGLFVREKSTKAICALTAYHVVHTDDLVECPAKCDAEPMLAYLHASIAELEDLIARRQSYNRDTSEYEITLARSKSQLLQLTTPTTAWFGRIMAYIYHVPTQADPTHSDCALIEVVDSEQLDDRNTYKHCGIPWTVTDFLDPNNEQVKRTDLLTMVGRSSGRTYAYKNEYKFHLSMTAHTGKVMETFESWAAWNESSNLTTKGDSGAAVVKQHGMFQGDAIGIVNGGTILSIPTRVGYLPCDVTFFESITTAADLLNFEVIGYDTP